MVGARAREIYDREAKERQKRKSSSSVTEICHDKTQALPATPSVRPSVSAANRSTRTQNCFVAALSLGLFLSAAFHA